MPRKLPLESADIEFFGLLADTIFSNPFSTGHERIQRLLGRLVGARARSQAGYYEKIVPLLAQRFAALESKGIRTLNDVDTRHVELLRYAYSFWFFHHSVNDFDQLIEAQQQSPEQPVAVPFAAELIDGLRGRGFTLDETHRTLALFYQLRRAYYFIDLALVGDSRPMHELRKALWNTVFTRDVRIYGTYLWDCMEDFSTLLLGETGTGKGSAAASIGRSGLIPFDPRSGRFKNSFATTFLAINLSQFPENLIESELFGHRKGAFTGAIEHHKGLFERCSANGSLFLDEIGDVSAPVQLKLLNVLQERRFSPVGSHESRRFSGRVIAATNRALDALRRDGRFRDDFYYRLSSNVISVPPLRERLRDSPAELAQLTGALLRRLIGHNAARLQEQVLEKLEQVAHDYAWPGNVRELEQAIRRILINGHYAVDSTRTVPQERQWLDALERGELNSRDLLQGYCRRLYARLGTYEGVAEQLELDRRTVKKYIVGE